MVPISYIANAPWLTYNTATKMKNLVLEVVVIASQRRGNLVVSGNFEWSEATS